MCADSKSSDRADEDRYVLTEEDFSACALANVKASGEYCWSILVNLSDK